MPCYEPDEFILQPLRDLSKDPP